MEPNTPICSLSVFTYENGGMVLDLLIFGCQSSPRIYNLPIFIYDVEKNVFTFEIQK